MNNLVKAAFRATTLSRTFTTPLKGAFGKREFTRTLWHMSKSNKSPIGIVSTAVNIHKPSINCSCGCGIKYIHTKSKHDNYITKKRKIEFLT